eukprot:1725836-Amphidinium_carterae.1
MPPNGLPYRFFPATVPLPSVRNRATPTPPPSQDFETLGLGMGPMGGGRSSVSDSMCNRKNLPQIMELQRVPMTIWSAQ